MRSLLYVFIKGHARPNPKKVLLEFNIFPRAHMLYTCWPTCMSYIHRSEERSVQFSKEHPGYEQEIYTIFPLDGYPKCRWVPVVLTDGL